MKSLILSLVLIILLSVSCTENENIITDEIEGTWELKEISFNGIDGKEINDWISNSITLYLDEDNSFYYSYNSGEWDFNGNKLILNSVIDMSREYKVIELSSRRLILETHLTEGQYCCNFDQFSDDQILTIRETFIKTTD